MSKIIVIFEADFNGELPPELIDEMTPERILIAQEDLKLEEWVEKETLRRGICLVAQSLLLQDKTPEMFVRDCEILGYSPSKKAELSFPLKLLEAVCFLHFDQYYQDEDEEKSDIRATAH